MLEIDRKIGSDHANQGGKSAEEGSRKRVRKLRRESHESYI